VRISHALHEQTRKLETAVEGTYASERGDPRVQLLSNALSVCRTADLELGRVTLAAKRVLLALQEQFSSVQQASVQLSPLLRWHRECFRLNWKRKSKAASHTPKIAAETIALIREMAV